MAIRTPVTICLVAGLVLAGCGTRLNPVNWFGPSQPAPAAAAEETNPLIPRRNTAASIFRANRDEVYLGQPIAQIESLLIERRPGGAIIRTTGIAALPGPYEVRLTPIEAASSESRLAFSFDARQQPGPRSTGPDARKVTTAVYLTDQDLAGIREIEVRGARNALVTRR